MRQHWTKEQKADFWQAFVRHRDEGCNIREAWSRAYADFRAEGKIAPGLRTFANWYRKAMRPQREEADTVDTVDQVDTVDTVDEVDGAEDEAPSEAAEVANEEAAEAEEAAPDPDYTRKLEAMLRLYRRRSEADVDAVCDYLLPGLFPAEEE